jgi:hypothetical protein
VYGPVATASQAVASWIGGDSVRLTVFVLALLNTAAFVGAALLLHRFAAGDAARQRRAALLWAANPLLIYHLAAGVHVDTLAIFFMVAALTVRSDAASGFLLGLGIGVKLNAGLVALGPAWQLRGSPRRLALVAGTATITVAFAYTLAGPHVLDQLGRASKQVSRATPWAVVKSLLQAAFGPGAYAAWIQVGSLALLVVLAWLLLRAAPEHSAPAVAAALVTAWLFAAPYALPWYDGLAFAMLALAAAWPLVEGFMVARTTILSLAYLPARQAGQPQDLGWLVDVVRSQAVPWILLALTAALLWRAARAEAPVRRLPASAAPRA